ncbi:hypothetical protein [Bacillus sp. FSL L8-0533]
MNKKSSTVSVPKGSVEKLTGMLSSCFSEVICCAGCFFSSS